MNPDSYDAWKLAYPPEWDEPDEEEQEDREQQPERHPCFTCSRFRPGLRCIKQTACAEAGIL